MALFFNGAATRTSRIAKRLGPDDFVTACFAESVLLRPGECRRLL